MNDQERQSGEVVEGHRPDRMTLAAMLILSCAGCSAERRGTMRPPSYATPTLGTDRRTVPRGQTIPPAGLGVDLVRQPSDAKTDRPLTTTSGPPADPDDPSYR